MLEASKLIKPNLPLSIALLIRLAPGNQGSYLSDFAHPPVRRLFAHCLSRQTIPLLISSGIVLWESYHLASTLQRSL